MIILELVHKISVDPMQISKQTGKGLESIFKDLLAEEPKLHDVVIKNVESQKLLKVEIKDE